MIHGCCLPHLPNDCVFQLWLGMKDPEQCWGQRLKETKRQKKQKLLKAGVAVLKQVYGLKWEPGRIDGGWERGAQETASIRPPRKERTISSEDRCGGVCVWGGESELPAGENAEASPSHRHRRHHCWISLSEPRSACLIVLCCCSRILHTEWLNSNLFPSVLEAETLRLGSW